MKIEPIASIELPQRARASEALKATPIIIITAEPKTENILVAKNAGVNNYIVKPFNAETQKGKIKVALGDF